MILSYISQALGNISIKQIGVRTYEYILNFKFAV